MDDDIDEFGNQIEAEEYSDSQASGLDENWEDEKVEESNDVPVQYFSYDSQKLSEPLVKPLKTYKDCKITTNLHDFHLGLLNGAAGLVRKFAIIGTSKHGKTSLAQWILENSLSSPKASIERNITIEKQRNTTLFPSFVSIPISTSQSKSMVFNIVDTQGHSDFQYDLKRINGLCDGAINVIDVVEGSEQALTNLPQLYVFNKLDRLLFDQRLPPLLACNRIFTLASELEVDLERIVFASTKFHFAFTLASIASLYNKFQTVKTTQISGEYLKNEQNFVEFVLEPLYKLFSCALLGDDTQPLLAKIGIVLDDTEWRLNPDDRIEIIMGRYFETGILPLIDAVVAQIPLRSYADTYNETGIIVPYEDTFSYLIKCASEDIFSGLKDMFVPYGNKLIPTSQIAKGSWYSERIDTSARNYEYRRLELEQSGSVLRVELEPIKPTNAEFTKLGEGLSLVCAYFNALCYIVGDVGNYLLHGPGELYLDSALGYMRSQGFNFKAGTMSAVFHETIAAESPLSFPTKLQGNPSQSVTVTANPISASVYDKTLVWCQTSTNCILIGPTLKSDVSSQIFESIREGFIWFTERGPLLDGLVQDVVINVLELNVSQAKSSLSLAMQRACCAATMLASPRLIEPIHKVAVVGGLAAGKACYAQVATRGGSVFKDEPILGTSLYITQALVPTIDSYGLETDIKCQLESDNDSRVTLSWHGWQQVSGDPLDRTARTYRLQSAPPESRARDFMVKTRRLKGLASEPQLAHYIDEDILSLIR